MRKKIFLIFALIMNGMNIQYCQTEKVGANVSVDTACGVIWYPAIMLSDSNYNAYLPRIALSGDDTVHVIWELGISDFMRLPYTRSISSGSAFEPVKELLVDSISFPYHASWPVILTLGERIWIFFTGATASYPPIYMITSSNAGSTWSSVIAITEDTSPEVTTGSLYGSNIGLIYPPDGGRRRILRSKNSGATWTKLNQDLGHNARIALTSGSLHLVQHTWLPPASEINYRRSSNLGDTWEIDTVISDIDGYWSDVPHIAGSDSKCGTELLTAWRDTKRGYWIWAGADIISRTALKGGGLWLAEQFLTEVPDGTGPLTAVNKNLRAVSWWKEVDHLTYKGMIRVSNQSLLDLCGPYDLSSTGSTAASPEAIAISSRAIHLVYYENDGTSIGTFRIFYRRGVFIQKDVSFSLSTSFLEMDTTEIGRTITDSVIVTNTGSDTMIVGTAISDNENFFVTPYDTLVPPFSEAVFKVHFKPKSYGTHTGKIIFYHNSQTSPDCFDVKGTATWRKETISYQQGDWNMVSIPMKPGPVQSLPSMFSYEGSYVPRDTMLFGRGYWAKPSAGEKTYLGSDVWSDTFAVKSGWNMIGSLTGEVLKSDITTIPENIITSLFYMFDGEKYVSADTIKPGRAYWLKVNQNGKIIMRDF